MAGVLRRSGCKGRRAIPCPGARNGTGQTRSLSCKHPPALTRRPACQLKQGSEIPSPAPVMMKNSLEYLIIVALVFIAARLGAQPSITSQPISRTNNVGDNAQFTVAATGSGILTYQWQFNGTNVSGATSNTLNVLIADASK